MYRLLLDQGKQEDFYMQYHYSLSMLEKTMPEGIWHEIAQENKVMNKLKSFQGMVNGALDKKNSGEFGIALAKHNDIFISGAEAVEALRSEYENVSRILDEYLAVRIEKDQQEWWLSLIGIIIAFLTATGVFILAHRNALHKEEAENAMQEAVIREKENLEIQNKELARAKEDAESATRSKSDFFANMSHELRTPLNSIIGMAQLLEKKKMDSEQREMFDSVKRSAENLLKIVNDILDISKIEAHEVRLEHIAFDAFQSIRHTIQSLVPLAAEKKLKLTDNLPDTGLSVFGDPICFSRILINLVGNAIRYTDTGSIHINIETRSQDDAQDTVALTVEVEDTGIGIPASKIEDIFEKFSQVDTTVTRRHGGTGLGLAITKELVEMMGGTISVKSTIGEGSIFAFQIPFEKVSAAPAPSEEREDELAGDQIGAHMSIPVRHARILLAEDHQMNQFFMKKLFSQLGIRNYHIAENGEEAIKEIQRNNYDLVLMDCHMPVMSGYDAAIHIKDMDDPFVRSVPIVAITANAMPGDRKRCLECGMDEYISKPVSIEAFKAVLSKWIDFSNTGDEGPDDIKTENGNGVEESPVNLDNLISNSMGDENFVRQMVDMFISQGEEQIQSLKAFRVDGESEDWIEISHALKGTAGSVGAERMRLLCADAQSMSNASAAERAGKLAEIEAAYNQAKVTLIKIGMYDQRAF
jgi:signal transduction histidine kinase/HPt (histidine-containing phosphotransfer) domain-containing protein